MASGRIVLDDQSIEVVISMLNDIKKEQSFVRINPSKLVVWIVAWFYQFGFEREKRKIINDHFNRREYLKNILKDAQSDDEIEEALKNALKTVNPKPQRRRGRKKKETQGESEKEENITTTEIL